MGETCRTIDLAQLASAVLRREETRFVARLAEKRNVSKVSRELGITRVTGYASAHRAGIFTSDDANERKFKFLGLRAEGAPRADEAGQLVIEQHQAMDWERGITSFAKGRIYPGGRVVL